MKFISIKIFLFLLMSNFSSAQEWMTSLEIAKKLAITQNKMLFVMWDESTLEPFPVLYKNEGKNIFIRDLFESDLIKKVIWDNFVPVVLDEVLHKDLYDKIKGKRRQGYIDRFNDDNIKIMDACGTIINTAIIDQDVINISKLIDKYALNTKFLTSELRNYNRDRYFYSSFYLGSKYIDYAIYVKKDVRRDVLSLSNIYLKEAKQFLDDANTEENKSQLYQRYQLTKLKQSLVLNRPKKVLRQLKKLEETKIEEANKNLLAFLYYTAYSLIDDNEKADQWKSELSFLNLQTARLIVNINS